MSKLEIFQTAINVATVLIAPIVAVIVGQKLQDKGQKRNINSFSSLLKNCKYIGEYRYQDVVIKGGVPAIIPEDLFNRVQERMEKNRRAPAMAKAKADPRTDDGMV